MIRRSTVEIAELDKLLRLLVGDGCGIFLDLHGFDWVGLG
jgi:hypothetical protein